VSSSSILSQAVQWLAELSLHWKIVLGVLSVILVAEFGLGRLAPRSKAYAGWKAGVEVLDQFWTGIILSIIYVLSVGPVGLGMRALGKDPLDRGLAAEPTFWRPHEPNPLGIEAASRHQF
jgi:hypothetical protein